MPAYGWAIIGVVVVLAIVGVVIWLVKRKKVEAPKPRDGYDAGQDAVDKVVLLDEEREKKEQAAEEEHRDSVDEAADRIEKKRKELDEAEPDEVAKWIDDV